MEFLASAAPVNSYSGGPQCHLTICIKQHANRQESEQMFAGKMSRPELPGIVESDA
jgi:hypothetical protein